MPLFNFDAPVQYLVQALVPNSTRFTTIKEGFETRIEAENWAKTIPNAVVTEYFNL